MQVGCWQPLSCGKLGVQPLANGVTRTLYIHVVHLYGGSFGQSRAQAIDLGVVAAPAVEQAPDNEGGGSWHFSVFEIF